MLSYTIGMNQWTTLYAPLLGRILLGGYFLGVGIQKALNFPAFVDFFGKSGYPSPLYFAAGVIAIEVILGIALVVDVKTRLAALILSVYVVLISFFFAQTSSVTDVQIFLQHMAIVGGLLMTAAYGTSRWTPSWQR